jgi:hypothetical protein
MDQTYVRVKGIWKTGMFYDLGTVRCPGISVAVALGSTAWMRHPCRPVHAVANGSSPTRRPWWRHRPTTERVLVIVPEPRDKCRCGGISQAREHRNVESDHVVHLLDIGLQLRGNGADAGVVHGQRDARIVPQRRFNPRTRGLTVEIRGQHLDGPSRLTHQTRRQGLSRSSLRAKRIRS